MLVTLETQELIVRGLTVFFPTTGVLIGSHLG